MEDGVPLEASRFGALHAVKYFNNILFIRISLDTDVW